MANPWALYQRSPSFVLGFHGTEKFLVDEVVAGKTSHLKKSDGKYEWLGHGVYFWENDPQRGLEWANSGNAKKEIAQPDVVGAIIDLGRCLDLTTRAGLDEVAEAYATLRDACDKAGLPLPLNTGGLNKFKRELDCRGCKKFCVNGHLAGNCHPIERSCNDRKQRTIGQPAG